MHAQASPNCKPRKSCRKSRYRPSCEARQSIDGKQRRPPVDIVIAGGRRIERTFSEPIVRNSQEKLGVLPPSVFADWRLGRVRVSRGPKGAAEIKTRTCASLWILAGKQSCPRCDSSFAAPFQGRASKVFEFIVSFARYHGCVTLGGDKDVAGTGLSNVCGEAAILRDGSSDVGTDAPPARSTHCFAIMRSGSTNGICCFRPCWR